MSKRLLSAAWMAAFACLAAFPIWSSKEAGLLQFLPPALAGATVGWKFQPFLTGPGSNAVAAAFVGALGALLCVPVVLVGAVLLSEPQLIISDVGRSFPRLLLVSFAAVGFFWWLILPMGAVGGFTLQMMWGHIERRRRNRSSETTDAQ